MDLAGYVAARGGDLLTRARRLTGDDRRAEAVVVEALSGLPASALRGADADDVAERALLRAATRRRAPSAPAGEIPALPARQRALLVLRYVEGVGPEEAAELLGGSPRRLVAQAEAARSSVAAAGGPADQEGLRRALSTPPAAAPPDLLEWVRAAAAARHRRRLLVTTTVVVAAVVAGSTSAGAAALIRRAHQPRTPHVTGLLAWHPRGELAADASFVRQASAVWRRGHPGLRTVYVLYAGRIGVGRLALLQALDQRGIGRVGLVADHDVAFNKAVLGLDVDASLPVKPPSLLLVPYDGNLGLPGLQPGPGSRLLQVLVAPGVDEVAKRGGNAPQNAPRPGFVALRITRGLSEPWLDLSGQQVVTALRAYRAGGPVSVGLVPTGNRLDLEPVRIRVQRPPTGWTPTGLPVAPDVARDDALWLAQTGDGADVSVAPVWSAVGPPLGGPVRLELLGDGRSAAVFDGVGAGAQLVVRFSEAADAYAGWVTTPTCLCAVAVGSDRVARLLVGTPPRAFPGRVAVTAVGSGLDATVQAFDARGRPLRVAQWGTMTP